ncbi:hypothetical protein vBAmePPT11V19_00024 [Alteromonas phage vB_AmeP_PT11-V19]|nr:hypothetical protein vBAmePPT11V19_00024 [Alteromonas phage vB_AmeP_PT11-V19]
MNLHQKVFLLNDFRGNQVKVERCTLNDVNKHFEAVKHLVPEEDHLEYVDNMGSSVINNMAFKVENKCFIYLDKQAPAIAQAYSLFGNNCPLEVLAMFSCILLLVDKKLFKISFYLHAGKTVKDFKSLLTLTSLKRQIVPHHPVVIRCDFLRNKLKAMYNRKGIQWES